MLSEDQDEGSPTKYRRLPPLPFITGEVAAATIGLAPIHKNWPISAHVSPYTHHEYVSQLSLFSYEQESPLLQRHQDQPRVSQGGQPLPWSNPAAIPRSNGLSQAVLQRTQCRFLHGYIKPSHVFGYSV